MDTSENFFISNTDCNTGVRNSCRSRRNNSQIIPRILPIKTNKNINRNRSQLIFFWPGNKYFRLCNLCHNYLALPLWCESNHNM